MIKYPTIQFLKWDTENFQKKIGKVSFEQAISYDEYNDLLIQGRLENYELLYIFVPEKKDFLKDICKEDMRLVDQKVIFSKKLNIQKDIVNISPFVFEYQEKCVSEQLLKLSLESGRFSRFYIDDNFPRSTFQKLYSEWIIRSVSKEIADEVLVFDKDDLLCGMLTYKVISNVATIGLIAVDPLVQGKNIGTELMMFLEYKLSQHSVFDINVATQLQNKKACAFYEKNKYSIKQITNIYHVWL